MWNSRNLVFIFLFLLGFIEECMCILHKNKENKAHKSLMLDIMVYIQNHWQRKQANTKYKLSIFWPNVNYLCYLKFHIKFKRLKKQKLCLNMQNLTKSDQILDTANISIRLIPASFCTTFFSESLTLMPRSFITSCWKSGLRQYHLSKMTI